MRRPTVRPRPDQVAALTRGVRLPLAPIPDDLLEILAESLSQAFHDIRADSPSTVTTGDEPEVTALMQARLNAMINEDTLWRQLVSYVARGMDSISFDGSHIEKSPDLSIVLSDAELRFPLVAEAKIIDAATSKTVALYCKHGIRRFVDGEYAWGNREAFMIGYVRDGSSINTALTALPVENRSPLPGAIPSCPCRAPALPTLRKHGMAGTSFIRPSDRQTAPDRFHSGICGWRRRRGTANRPTPISSATQPTPQRPPGRTQSAINHSSAQESLSFQLNSPCLFKCLNHST